MKYNVYQIAMNFSFNWDSIQLGLASVKKRGGGYLLQTKSVKLVSVKLLLMYQFDANCGKI